MGNTILTLIAFGVILVPLIFIHELGHFLMAKLAGITVLEFGIGFPPRAALLFKRGDTEYTLNWLPLGGFVRPLGEDLVAPLGEEETEAERRKYVAARSDGTEEALSHGVAVSDVAPGKRLLFFAGGPLFNTALAVLLFAVAGMVGQPIIDRSDVVVYALDWDSPLLPAGIRPGDIIRAVDGQPVAYTPEPEPIRFAEDVAAYLLDHAGQPVTLTVERAGARYDFTVALDAAAENIGARLLDGGDVLILEVNPNGPAEAAGLEANDLVRAGYAETRYPAARAGVAYTGGPEAPAARPLDDFRLYTSSDLSRAIHDGIGAPVTMLVARGDASTLHQLTMQTRTNPPEGEGPTGIVLTTDYPMTIAYEKPLEALQSGLEQTAQTVLRVLEAPIMILRGEISGDAARPLGIVGISQIGSQVIEESIDVQTPAPAINYAALISIALGVTNLLPIPALDGGRILFTLVEIIRGKRMDPAREGMIHLIGLMALMVLMVVLLFADILNPVQLR
ncbi:MAG: site-2 protease family protein [Anaerolineae bacterium]|nr:site-2 protease family protein [Anaerolineae bacterium]